MEIPKHFLNKFKRIYKKNYDEKVTDAEALEMATNVAKMFLILPKPPRKDK